MPLVLHGGSGLADADFKRAIQEGISKVNIFTDINVAAVEAEFKKFEYMDKGIIDLIPAAVEAVKQETVKNAAFFQCWKSNGMAAPKAVLKDTDISKIVEMVVREICRKDV